MRRSAATNPFLAGKKRRPVVVGHRGVPTLHQENTLAGFRRAVALGIPAIELDVRLTGDGHAVVFHDSVLERMTGVARHMVDLTWEQVSKLRLRREIPMGPDLHGQEVVVRYDREERIPLLAEVLAEIAGKVAINIELKLDLPRWWQVEVGATVAKVIAEAEAEDRVIVTSFDPRKLRAAARVRPNLATGFCFDDTMLDFARPVLDWIPAEVPPAAAHGEGRLRAKAQRLLNRLLDTNLVGRLLGTRVVGAEHTLVGRDTVTRLHEKGVAIGTHTVFPLGSTPGKRIAPSAATTTEVERLVGLGVDWIESDDPARLLEVVERLG